jgi:NaMN:DMB phosphoribosyltransferase
MSTTARARCEILGLLEGVSGSMPENPDELSCEVCFQTKAEIFQVIGNYCLHCWQQETHPDV